MYFAQFFHHAVGSDELIPAPGADGIMLLDGRWSLDHMIRFVLESNGGFKQHPAFQLMKCPGRRISKAIPVSGLIFVRRNR